MLLPYFTILHWSAIAFFVILFILLSILSIKSKNQKIIVGLIFSSFLVTTFLAVLSIFILEKYTKKAKILDVNQRRVLYNETFVLKGRIQNIGNFRLNYCRLEVKLVNQGYSMGQLQGNLFKSSGMDFFKKLFEKKEEKKARPNVVKKSFIIARKIYPKEIKYFSVIMKYPPYFSNTYLNYKLYCH